MKILIIALLVIPLTTFAGNLRLMTNSQANKVYPLRSIIYSTLSNNRVQIIVSGSDNATPKMKACYIVFPGNMREHALKVYQEIMRRKKNTTFTVTCKSAGSVVNVMGSDNSYYQLANLFAR